MNTDPTFEHQQPVVTQYLEVRPTGHLVKLTLGDESMSVKPDTARRLAMGLEEAADQIDPDGQS